MITELLVNIFTAVVGFLTNILPVGNIPEQIDSAFTFMASAFSKSNVFFPTSVVVTMLGIVFIIEGALLTFKGSNWIYNKIRGAG
jgi:hypothetical protein